MYIVQRTENAHPHHNVPDSAWFDLSRHRVQKRAVQAYSRAAKGASAGLRAWSYNVRITNEHGDEVNAWDLDGFEG